jgi:S-DNA-T family DNA segregation ATPase FtsK/SpoIIIE
VKSGSRKKKTKSTPNPEGIQKNHVFKEIRVVFMVLAVVLTLVSFLSFHPADPSLHHSVSAQIQVHNDFGLIGAYLSGFFFGLFGLGAFWIPVLMLIAGGHLLHQRLIRMLGYMGGGGLLLIIATGCLLAIFQEHYVFHEVRYSAGGLIGTALKVWIVRYANPVGSVIIMLVLLLVGLILATGLSFSTLLYQTGHLFLTAIRHVWCFGGKMAIPMICCCRSWLGKIRSRRPSVLKSSQINTLPDLHRMSSQAKVPQPPASSSRNQATPPEPKPSEPEKALSIPIKPLAPPPEPASNSSGNLPKLDTSKKNHDKEGFQLPLLSFLNEPSIPESDSFNQDNLRMQAGLLESKLEDFGIKGQVVEISPGPVITTFEYKPAPGVKISKIVNLTDDLALALSAISIRIVAPIPGKDVIGIEIPNADREQVSIREIIGARKFETSGFALPLCLGKDIVGHPVIAPLEKMPHLLIAGATGTGKSVGLNAMITSLLYKCTPDQVKLLMVDPKRIELSLYDGIPHLISPVVTDMKKATNALFWAVKEMERRYEALAGKKVRNINQYNAKVKKENQKTPDEPQPIFPYIVIIIDELADLMMVSSRDVEIALTRLAQMARAAGIHMILATQRPSVDVLTGVIKANFPTRMSFQVSSKTDSRTIIDSNGAENLLGNGDMLFVPPGTARLQRIHGAYISEDELTRITDFLKAQKSPEYVEDVTEGKTDGDSEGLDMEDRDEKYDEAVALVTKTRQASISMVQRHLRIGYNRAARIIEMMEMEGIVGPSDGVKGREVLVRDYEEIS